MKNPKLRKYAIYIVCALVIVVSALCQYFPGVMLAAIVALFCAVVQSRQV